MFSKIVLRPILSKILTYRAENCELYQQNSRVRNSFWQFPDNTGCSLNSVQCQSHFSVVILWHLRMWQKCPDFVPNIDIRGSSKLRISEFTQNF